MLGIRFRPSVFALALAAACASDPPRVDPPRPGPTPVPVPDWVERGLAAAFPDARFLQAVGAAPVQASEADARAAAEQQARAALVRIFSSRVHSELRVDELFRAVDDATRTDLTLEETVTVIGDGTLEGARAAAFHTHAGQVHCLLVLDRAAGASEMARRILEHDADAAQLLQRAGAEARRGASLGLLLQAYDRAREARILRVPYAILAGRGMERRSDVGETVLASLHAATATLRLGVEGGAGQRGRVGERLREPLSVRLTDGAEAAVAGVPIAFVAEGAARAELAPPVVATDAAGRARTEVAAIHASGLRTNLVVCAIEGLRTRGLTGPEARIEYLLPVPATTRVLITVAATAHGAAADATALRTGVQDGLSGGGYRLVDPPGVDLAAASVASLQARLRDQADVVVRVVAAAEDGGMLRGEMRARARATVQVVDLEAGTQDEFASDPVDGRGESHAEAAARSLAGLGSALGRVVEQRLDRALGVDGAR